MKHSKPQTVGRARDLRKRMTDAEVILWSRLRRHGESGLHFRKQHPIGPYIADFACTRAKLVIEVDGETHITEEEHDYDARRNQYMVRLGWRVLRFNNENVYRRLESVMDGIERVSAAPLRPPR